MRGETLIFVCSYGLVVGPCSTHTKIKVSPLTGLQMEKNIFFLIPEMPSKTFVMVFKKLPDHFKLVFLNIACYRRIMSSNTWCPADVSSFLTLPPSLHRNTNIVFENKKLIYFKALKASTL